MLVDWASGLALRTIVLLFMKFMFLEEQSGHRSQKARELEASKARAHAAAAAHAARHARQRPTPARAHSVPLVTLLPTTAAHLTIDKKQHSPTRRSRYVTLRPRTEETHTALRWEYLPQQAYGSVYRISPTFRDAIPSLSTPLEIANDDPFDAFSVHNLPPHVVPLLQTGKYHMIY